MALWWGPAGKKRNLNAGPAAVPIVVPIGVGHAAHDLAPEHKLLHPPSRLSPPSPPDVYGNDNRNLNLNNITDATNDEDVLSLRPPARGSSQDPVAPPYTPGFSGRNASKSSSVQGGSHRSIRGPALRGDALRSETKISTAIDKIDKMDRMDRIGSVENIESTEAALEGSANHVNVTVGVGVVAATFTRAAAALASSAVAAHVADSHAVLPLRGPSEHRVVYGGNPFLAALWSSTAAVGALLPSTGFNIGVSVFLILFAGFASGMTVGLLSVDTVALRVLQDQGNAKEKRRVKEIANILEHHHLVLVTLLLANSLAMEALPIFFNRLVPEWAAVLLSVSAILLFGEIIPQALCTGKWQIRLVSKGLPAVRLLINILYPFAYPIALLLDRVLGENDQKTAYARSHLKALIRLQLRPNHFRATHAHAHPQPNTHGQHALTTGSGTLPRPRLTTHPSAPSLLAPRHSRTGPANLDHFQGITFTPPAADRLAGSKHVSQNLCGGGGTKTDGKALRDGGKMLPWGVASFIGALKMPLLSNDESGEGIDSPSLSPRNQSLCRTCGRRQVGSGLPGSDSLDREADREKVNGKEGLKSGGDTGEFYCVCDVASRHQAVQGPAERQAFNAFEEGFREGLFRGEACGDKGYKEDGFRGFKDMGFRDREERHCGGCSRLGSAVGGESAGRPTQGWQTLRQRDENCSGANDHSNPPYRNRGEIPECGDYDRVDGVVSIDDCAREGGSEGLCDNEVAVIEGALDLATKTASRIMVPIDQVYMLEWNTLVTENVRKEILARGHSRVPVYRSYKENVTGLLLVKNLIAIDFSRLPRAGDLVRRDKAPIFCKPLTPLYTLLTEFQRGRHMAFVVAPDALPFYQALSSRGPEAARAPTSRLDSSASQHSNQPQPQPQLQSQNRTRHSSRGKALRMNSLRSELKGGVLRGTQSPSESRSGSRSGSRSRRVEEKMRRGIEETRPRPGALLGILTMEDLIEELIQEEIYDEFDHFGNYNPPFYRSGQSFDLDNIPHIDDAAASAKAPSLPSLSRQALPGNAGGTTTAVPPRSTGSPAASLPRNHFRPYSDRARSLIPLLNPASSQFSPSSQQSLSSHPGPGPSSQASSMEWTSMEAKEDKGPAQPTMTNGGSCSSMLGPPASLVDFSGERSSHSETTSSPPVTTSPPAPATPSPRATTSPAAATVTASEAPWFAKTLFSDAPTQASCASFAGSWNVKNGGAQNDERLSS